jgi:NAD+ synthase
MGRKSGKNKPSNSRQRLPTGGIRIQPAKEAARIESLVRKVVRDASAKGVVVGLSGGVDSAVVGAMCVRALGRDRVMALMMPSDHTPEVDIEDAEGMAATWGVRAARIPISRIAELIISSAKLRGTRIAQANVEARVRMILLYYYANSLGYLVAGTGDRSEAMLGYFTKFGDGGVDFLPIVHLYKTQVRQLGAYLGLPRSVVEKQASPQLWPGHRASDEIPADYDRLDPILHQLFDKASRSAAAKKGRSASSIYDRVMEMYSNSFHKRKMPPSLQPE